MIAVEPNPMSDFDAPPVIRTLSTSTNPLSLEIVSPLVAPAAAVCVSSATVSDMNKSPESPKAVRLDFAPVTAKSSASVAFPDDCSVPVTLTPVDASDIKVAVPEMPMSLLVNRTSSTSTYEAVLVPPVMTTKPLSLEIVSPLVAPAAAVCVIVAAVFDKSISPDKRQIRHSECAVNCERLR